MNIETLQNSLDNNGHKLTILRTEIRDQRLQRIAAAILGGLIGSAIMLIIF